MTRLAVQVALIVLLVAAVIWVNQYAADHDLVRLAARRFGYPGILAAAAASGFNLVVPVPVIAFFPFFMEAGFAPVPTVLVIATGMTLGDLLGYLLGHAARDAVGERRWRITERLQRLRVTHPYLPFVVMFLYAAFAPIPNEILVIPLAFMRYPLVGVFTAVLLGNVIFNSLVAAGVVHVFGLF
jgi:membrane protein YqaA with SNARE-associated domain